MQASAPIIIAGHICLDLIPALADAALPAPGRLMRIGPATVSTGGAVANTGLALHRLGAEVRLMGKVGDDIFGRAILDVLRGHDHKLAEDMIVAAGEATSYSIVINPPGVDRSFMHFPGTNDTFTDADVPYETFGDARLFHFGYPPVMAKMYAAGGAELRSMFMRVRERGIATTLDLCQPDPDSEAGRLDWAALLSRVLPNVDVFFPSVDELMFMLDRPMHTRLAAGEDVIDGALLRRLADRLTAWGTATVVIKLGERGLYVRTSSDPSVIAACCRRVGLVAADWTDREIYAPCFVARAVVGTTGSGDCTIAGFLAALSRGDGPVEAATAATAVGAASVEAADATGGVPPWGVIEQRLNAGWPRHRGSIRFENPTPPADASGTVLLR